MPYTVLVGGLLNKAPSPLDQDLELWISSFGEVGFIVVTFGSMISSVPVDHLLVELVANSPRFLRLFCGGLTLANGLLTWTNLQISGYQTGCLSMTYWDMKKLTSTSPTVDRTAFYRQCTMLFLCWQFLCLQISLIMQRGLKQRDLASPLNPHTSPGRSSVPPSKPFYRMSGSSLQLCPSAGSTGPSPSLLPCDSPSGWSTL